MGDNASSVDIESIRETYNHILEAEKVVGEWIFHIDRCPITLKIKVVKFIAGPNRGKYMGIANYQIQSPRQAGPYISLTLKDTVQEALEDALRGFLMWYDPEEAEKI
ncbi:MAG TPA: hypothetical protein ENF57_04335, partial [Candidatus Korarchaeota archaeon]|nr:hypothetical protein [Candidatus Korarchaeota archaeon]